MWNVKELFEFYWVIGEYFGNPSKNRPKYTTVRFNADFVDHNSRHRYRRTIKYRK